MNLRHHLRLPAVALAIATALVAAISFGGRPPAPPQHPADAAAAATSAAANAHPPPSVSSMERAKRGVVVVERGGRPLALGFVLTGDGRMLSTLSALGDGNGINARYADGSSVNVRIGHSDRTWDLALLVPQMGRWPEGLTAASGDPMRLGSQIRVFTQVRGRTAVSSVVLKGRSDLVGGDGEVLRDAIEITTRIPGTDYGAPIVDDRGQVVALVSRACAQSGADAGACRPVAYGAPTEVLRQFLRSAPANAIPPAPWLGIQVTSAITPLMRGVRIVSVHPESPAGDAGLKGGGENEADIIISVDGVPVQTPEKVAEVVRARAVGDKVEVIVLREGRLRVVSVTLRASPSGRPAAASPAATRP
ncbi:MAG: serine protease [Deltaproteobacteria bacterium]|nr:serine protease [Deltaproteobacteria bacterium]